MSAAIGWGIVLGATLGLGAWSMVSLLPAMSRPTLADRLAPYIQDLSTDARDHVSRTTIDPIPFLGAFLAPAVARAERLLTSVLGRADEVERSLGRARSSKTVDRIRMEQVVCGTAGFALAVALVAVVPSLRSMPPVAVVAAPVAGAILGVTVRERLLHFRAAQRVSRIVGELPTVLEFLSLSLSAGEGVHDALRRVTTASSGELSAEFSIVLTDVGLGIHLTEALSTMDRRLGSPALTRFIDQVVGALERGSPLQAVLQAQADDARTASRRALLDAAGKKELAMMVPLVFAILPLTIAIAVFPGFVVLQTQF